LLHFFLQRGDLRALGPQDLDQLLVLGDGAGEVTSRLEQLLLEDLDLAGRVGEATPEQSRLVLQELDLCLEMVDLFLVALQLFLWIGRSLLRHRGSYLPSSGGAGPFPIYAGPLRFRGGAFSPIRSLSARGMAGLRLGVRPSPHGDESRVGDHAVVGPDTLLGDVPGSNQDLD